MAIRAAVSRLKAASFPSSYMELLRIILVANPAQQQQQQQTSHLPLLYSPRARIGEGTAAALELRRKYHDGRPRGPLWRGKKMIGKEALFVILGLKRFKDDEEKLGKFIKTHVLRLLKMDKIAVLIELERQEEVDLAVKVLHLVLITPKFNPNIRTNNGFWPSTSQIFRIIQKEDWYKPDVYLYKDLIVALAKCKKMEEAMEIWESMRKEELFPDSQTYAEVIRGFLRYGSPADAMNIYEEMKKSPEPPEEMPFRILLKGLLPHPLLRNRVKQDFEELFPERHIYDPPEEIFGLT
ncbi:hypothetical protein BHM03_00036331 [Ensete ventricosum]|nr:hypothetical protein BHM03_00036331 [Ensete ventricosum]